MARYIVLPRKSGGRATLNLGTRRIKSDAPLFRSYRAEAREAQAAETWHAELERWVADGVKQGVHDISYRPGAAQTGARVLTMSSQLARELDREIDDVHVLRDQPINLIGPGQGSKRISADQLDDDEDLLWHLDTIKIREAQNAGTLGHGEGSRVAVLDTGVDSSHPEISKRLSGSYELNPEDLEIHPQAAGADSYGHGTHIAGLVAGARVGTAPAAELVSCEMLPNGRGRLSEFVQWISWASTQVGLHVVNLSAGLEGFIPEIQEPIRNLTAVGILPIVAVGNEGRDTSRSPGNYRDVLSVGATTSDGRVAGFSSSAKIIVDNTSYNVPHLVAPGRKVISCVRGGGYKAWNGTSMAAPIVSGLAAILIEKYPMIDVLDLKEAILEKCVDLGVSAERQGAGQVMVQ